MLGECFPAGEESKGWGEMRLTVRELGIIIIIVGFQTFFWSLSIFSSADGGLQPSPLKVFPGTLVVALTLTLLRSRAGKRGEPAAASSPAMHLTELPPDSTHLKAGVPTTARSFTDQQISEPALSTL